MNRAQNVRESEPVALDATLPASPPFPREGALIHIVHVMVGVPDPDAGNGVSKVVHHLATEQQQGGHEVEVWSIVGGPTAAFAHEYTLRTFVRQRNPFSLDAQLRATLKALPRRTWVQLHSVFIPEYRAIAQSLRRAAIAYGTTPHGGYSPEGLRRNRLQKALYVTFVERAILRGARMIHVVGDSERTDVAALVGDAHIVLIPNGQVPLTRASPVASAAADRPIIGFVGRLDQRHKGLDLLVSGFASYAKQGGTGQLWIVGSGPDQDRLAALAREEGVQDRVRLTGARFGAEKLALMSSFDAFAHTSRWEGLPLACLEAAAMGIALVVTPPTNLQAYVRRWDSGILVEAPSHEAVAAALTEFGKAFADGRSREMGRQAARMIDEAFRWDRIARQLTNTWKECLDGT